MKRLVLWLTCILVWLGTCAAGRGQVSVFVKAGLKGQQAGAYLQNYAAPPGAGETGLPFTKNSAINAAAMQFLGSGNAVRPALANSVVYEASGAPNGTDYVAEADFIYLGNPGTAGYAALDVRMQNGNGYEARLAFYNGQPQWIGEKITGNGTAYTQLFQQNASLTASHHYKVRWAVYGQASTVLLLYVRDLGTDPTTAPPGSYTLVSFCTDSANPITSSGFAGISGNGTNLSDTAGVAIQDFQAYRLTTVPVTDTHLKFSPYNSPLVTSTTPNFVQWTVPGADCNVKVQNATFLGVVLDTTPNTTALNSNMYSGLTFPTLSWLVDTVNLGVHPLETGNTLLPLMGETAGPHTVNLYESGNNPGSTGTLGDLWNDPSQFNGVRITGFVTDGALDTPAMPSAQALLFLTLPGPVPTTLPTGRWTPASPIPRCSARG